MNVMHAAADRSCSGMKRTLTPRGPDAEGTYFDEDAALVHRRLIVIDPEGGKQPMTLSRQEYYHYI